MSNRARIIFHIDMNSFYASVEMAHNPSLKGKPLAIAGNPGERKGIIVTSSYEARSKGVKTTMPIWEAKKLCPNLIIIRPNFDRYRHASSEIFKLLAEITPEIEPVSIDEGYMDVTQHKKDPIDLANFIQQKLLTTLNLPCSIGIGPNKFLAKTASDMKKPLGITILRIRELPHRLWPLSVNDMYGIGKQTTKKLNKINIFTIGDLAKADVYSLSQLLGINGERLKNQANGIDPRPVDPNSVNEFKSIGNSQTLPEDTTNKHDIYNLLNQLAGRVAERLQRRKLMGQTVQLMIRYHNRETITRSQKLFEFTDEKDVLIVIANQLFKEHWNKEPIRLLGITAQDILEKKYFIQQLDLFTYESDIKKAKLAETVHSLSAKYGDKTFKKLEESSSNKLLRTSFQKDFLNDFQKNKTD